MQVPEDPDSNYALCAHSIWAVIACWTLGSRRMHVCSVAGTLSPATSSGTPLP